MKIKPRRKLATNNTSGVSGVMWRKDIKKWRVRVVDEFGKKKHVGNFDDFYKACLAKEIELHRIMKAKEKQHG